MKAMKGSFLFLMFTGATMLCFCQQEADCHFSLLDREGKTISGADLKAGKVSIYVQRNASPVLFTKEPDEIGGSTFKKNMLYLRLRQSHQQTNWIVMTATDTMLLTLPAGDLYLNDLMITGGKYTPAFTLSSVEGKPAGFRQENCALNTKDVGWYKGEFNYWYCDGKKLRVDSNMHYSGLNNGIAFEDLLKQYQKLEICRYDSTIVKTIRLKLPRNKRNPYSLVNEMDTAFVGIEYDEDMGAVTRYYYLKYNIPDGKYEIYVNDTLDRIEFRKNGLRDSISIGFYRNGNVRSIESYKLSHFKGETFGFYEGGQKYYIAYHAKECLVGEHFEYFTHIDSLFKRSSSCAPLWCKVFDKNGSYLYWREF